MRVIRHLEGKGGPYVSTQPVQTLRRQPRRFEAHSCKRTPREHNLGNQPLCAPYLFMGPKWGLNWVTLFG